MTWFGFHILGLLPGPSPATLLSQYVHLCMSFVGQNQRIVSICDLLYPIFCHCG